MSRECFSVHMYGAETNSGFALRPELEEAFEDDILELRHAFEKKDWDAFPIPVPESVKGLEMACGPDDIVYIGVPAVMPYEAPQCTQARIDEAVRDFGKYLFGDDTELVSKEIYDVWME